MPTTRRLILIIVILFLLLLFLVVPGVSWSQTPQNPWADPARELAKKIATSSAPRQTFALTVRNMSSLSDVEVAAVREALEAALRTAGLGVAGKSNTAPELRITLSENLQGLLWVAEIAREEARDVAMISFAKASAPASTETSRMFALQSKLVLEQNEPILGFGFSKPRSAAEARYLMMVGSSQLAVYAPDGFGWKRIQSAQLPQAVVASRDPIAYLHIDEESHYWLLIAGFQCHGGPLPTPQLTCSEIATSRDARSTQRAGVSEQIVLGRNYFRVPEIEKGDETRKYSEMWLRQDGKTIMVRMRLDGGAWILREAGAGADEATKYGWGSQLGVLDSGCGKGTQLLVTAPSDWTEADAIQAVEFDGVQPINVSAPLLMPGPVMNLHFDFSKAFALAVVHNLKTNRYEAYTLTLSCGH
jgi:hypothetical protein